MSKSNDESDNREALFWDLAAPMLIKGEAEEGTMMGFKCLRVHGNFFASLDRKTKGLIVKLPKDRVLSLIEQENAVSFAPNGRVFKEWAMIPEGDENYWRAILEEAREFVANK